MSSSPKEWLTVNEIETKTGIPNNTLRRYIRQHGEFITHKKDGKSYLISNESIDVINHIRELYQENNLTVQQVRETLDTSKFTKTITQNHEQEFMTINEKLEILAKRLDEQDQKIQQQQQYIDTKLNERDQKLMTALKESLDTRKQIATAEAVAESKKPKWLKWLNQKFSNK